MSVLLHTRPCHRPAAFRYTWMGSDESCICVGHAVELSAIASAMGLPLQLVPADSEAGACTRQVADMADAAA